MADNAIQATASEHTTPAGRRPGRPEILAAAIGYAVAYFLTPPLASAADGDDPVIRGLILAAMSGVAGLVGFGLAYAIRVRDWSAFGVRRISGRWVLGALGIGLGVFVLCRIALWVIVLIVGSPADDPQDVYQDAASGGALALTLQLLFIAVLTPIGEEFTFRAVLVSALRRYGAVVSVIVSTALFAFVHGWNLALVTAIIVGTATAILMLRTRSVWPGVIVHAVNNGVATVLALLASSAG